MPLGFGEEASDGSFTHYNRGLEVALEPWLHHPPGVANMCTWDVPCAHGLCRDATKLLRIAETICCWDGGYDEILDELLDDDEAEAEAAAAEEEAEEAEEEGEADPTFWLCCDAEDAMFGKVLMATGKLFTPTFRLRWADLSFTDFLGLLLRAPALVRQARQGERRDYDTAGTHPRDRCSGRSPWDLIWQSKYGALRRLVALVREREIRR